MDAVVHAVDAEHRRAVDRDALAAFLEAHIDGISGSFGPLEIRRFPSGLSNLTFLVRVGGRELVLRMPPYGKKAASAHDMGREYTLLEALHPVFPFCPKPLAFACDGQVMNCSFYIMERIPGIVIHRTLPVKPAISPAAAEKLCIRMMEVMAHLHLLDYRLPGLEAFAKPKGYILRQVQGWAGRFREFKTPDVPDFGEVIAWLLDRRPPDTPHPCIVHNDYKLDNLVLDPDDPVSVKGILDWEMAAVGDPLMDLGSAMAYWIDPDDPEEMQLLATQPSAAPGMLSRRRMIGRYAEAVGRNVENFDFYYTFGLFRLACIVQQIYYRYYHGQLKESRFADLGARVVVYERAARRAMRGLGI